MLIYDNSKIWNRLYVQMLEPIIHCLIGVMSFFCGDFLIFMYFLSNTATSFSCFVELPLRAKENPANCSFHSQ